MLTLSKQTDYSFIIISQLKGKDTFIPLSDLVQNTDLPQRFLARIAATLVNKKLLISREGRVGGYKLASNINTTSLYDFLAIFEKRLSFLDCLGNKSTKCKYEKVCLHRHGVKVKLNDVVVSQLKRTKLMDLF
ncbi:hypothetical protein A2334_02330 [Candidatus Roizmanbacteria bacterium RIFOXYB2_FULL_38_10]|uniref:Transcriptional regulator, BadM/Rrf2 family n=2 Tax=Microgenomates group TaxID=1794810 RepID=A0A0G1TR75_9BACT|nr:MAG: Transcriptional regulator, BadM/Rrf2 family [Candidatus Woesebacteria bacterium GW2011_GWF2_46_8]OGK62287.1 MAG: hypothetical protein A3K47_01640 [Candidatus Roizmanbacteria bacterium RIFOXYA2_FULL_38_14]OGK63486.1 MAG: hypothetical protein A3K27_01640 [Candidatus Roizmanbacteria bacterium RIFOXYA1_FULL_37_12]OGK65332.1 MAG: hypothetical protein A3K38_01640 [Candidatus Roizmanbacteria bacterium RIFOXYB1_FULL_40_23]OGK67954.1 MAG: hypothetical protein A2334_02330 [Candidatus Roizmanbacte